jgi:hypothetical protein
MRHIVVMKPKFWMLANAVKNTFRNRTLQEEKAVSTALSTIRTLDNVQAQRALTQDLFLSMEPDSKTILNVSDVSSALRQFKTAYAQYPSQLLGKRRPDVSKAMRDCELQLLRVNDFLEIQAQIAGVTVQDFSSLGDHTRALASMLGRFHVWFKRKGEELYISPLLIRRVSQAFHKFSRSAVAYYRTQDKTPTTFRISKNRKDSHKALEDKKQQAEYMRQIHQDARQLLLAMDTLPAQEDLQRFRNMIQDMIKTTIEELNKSE